MLRGRTPVAVLALLPLILSGCVDTGDDWGELPIQFFEATYRGADGSILEFRLDRVETIAAPDGRELQAARISIALAEGDFRDFPLVVWVDASWTVVRVDATCTQFVDGSCVRSVRLGESAGLAPAYGIGLPAFIERPEHASRGLLGSREPSISKFGDEVVVDWDDGSEAPLGTIRKGSYLFSDGMPVPREIVHRHAGQSPSAAERLTLETFVPLGLAGGVDEWRFAARDGGVGPTFVGRDPWPGDTRSGQVHLAGAMDDIPELREALRSGCLAGYGTRGVGQGNAGLLPVGVEILDEFRVHSAGANPGVWNIWLQRDKATGEEGYVLRSRDAPTTPVNCNDVASVSSACSSPDAMFDRLRAYGSGSSEHDSFVGFMAAPSGNGPWFVMAYLYAPAHADAEGAGSFFPHQVLVQAEAGWVLRANAHPDDLEGFVEAALECTP